MSKTVLKALCAVQADLAAAGIAKADTNSFDNYQFRGIDAVLNAMAPILSKHGVIIMPSVKTCEIRTVTTSKGTPQNHAKVQTEFTLYDDKGDSITHSFFGEGMDRGDKAVNKACTAAYKYFLFEAFCIPVEGTPDADRESPDGVGVPSFTVEQKSAFDNARATGDPLAYLELMSGHSQEVQTALVNSAPDGQKMDLKRQCKDLEGAAHKILDDYAEQIETMCANEDPAVLSLTGELSTWQRGMVRARFDAPTQARISDFITQLKRQAV